MEHVIKVRPIKVSAPKAGLDALLNKEKDEDKKDFLPKMPDAHSYYAIPERRPHLRSFIRSFEWDCVNNHIEMLIDETPAFSAYEWITGINENKEDCLTLVLMDQTEREVARIRFVNLELTGHGCGLTTPEAVNEYGIEDDELQPVRHTLFFKYSSSEFNKFPKLSQDESLDQDSDVEWSETDLTIKTDDSLTN